MALVKVKPTSAGRRGVVKVVNANLHKGRPLASLTIRVRTCDSGSIVWRTDTARGRSQDRLSSVASMAAVYAVAAAWPPLFQR